MKIKTLGFMLMFISIVMSTFIFFFHGAVHDIANSGIETKPECTQTLNILEAHNNFHTKISMVFAIILFLTGLLLPLYCKDNDENNILKKLKNNKKKNLENIKKSLTEDENIIFDEIIKSKGEILQTSLQDKTKLTKVKITRVLTKLENKKIITRKRYGMTKIIILEKRE